MDSTSVDTTGNRDARTVTLPARPEPIRVRVDNTAVVVIDMQNAYASPGGYLDLAGFDIDGAARVIEQSIKVLDTARSAGLPIVYFQNGWDAGLCRGGRAGIAQLAQIERAQDDARPARAPGQIARPRRLGL